MTEQRFTDKVAIVTGAGQGIGECYAQRLAAEGAKVVVADLNDEKAEQVAKDIANNGGTAIAVKVDVSDPESADAMGKATIEEFGGVDFLVNNAAIYHGMKLDALVSIDVDYYRRFMEVNMNGALWCTRAVWQSMSQRGGGAIVNQSSTAAWMGAGYYGLAKVGINGLTHALAGELGMHNIRVNALAPGLTDTEATRTVVPPGMDELVLQAMKLKRMGQPDDMADTCLFLLSDQASWITGQILQVDGGQILRL